jgi:ketosteroid isomerase-like protein
LDDGQDEVSALVARVAEAASAYIRGDMDRYLELIHYVRGFTLMSPIGGPASRYEDRSEIVRASASLFNGGECQLESLEIHAWDNTVVLAVVERQRGVVGGLPGQDWSLRVTLVFRREADDWLLVHRHADPLVNPIGPQQLAALARGDAVA